MCWIVDLFIVSVSKIIKDLALDLPVRYDHNNKIIMIVIMILP